MLVVRALERLVERGKVKARVSEAGEEKVILV